jgi:signal transduction histidine kinase
MTAGRRHRTLSVRGWFALAAVCAFVLVIILVFAGVYLLGLGADEPQDRTASAAGVLRQGADRWDDPAWLETTAAELEADGVQFALFEGEDELYRSSGIGDGATAAPPWDGGSDDGVIRFLHIDGTEPRLSAQLYTSLDADNLLPPITLATVAIGTVAAAVSLAFGRPFVRPLRAAQGAARQVSDGDMTVDLPGSRVTEINDVNTALDAMTTELHRSLAQQAALERERRMFIAAIAHDLRTPLFALRGYLDGLDSGLADTPERRADYLAVAREKARTLEQLVSGLFDYSRLEYLDDAPAREPLDLADFLHDLVDGLQPQAEAKGLTLAFQPPDHPCPVDADRGQLARAASNLLDNALRYTPAAGRVDVTCGVAGATTWFTVSDTGPGIAPEDLPHLFQPLYRGNGTSVGDAGTAGAGLGLAIAQRILTAHHGNLTATNTPPTGATFTATLPTRSSPSPPRPSAGAATEDPG